MATCTKSNRRGPFVPFKKALLYARSLKLGSQKEWDAWSKSDKRPANMPSHPNHVHQDAGWQGYGHWLGTGNLRTKKFLPFMEALLHARALKLKSANEWHAWSKSGARLANMPFSPDKAYTHDGWQGWGHWLGTGNAGVKKDHQFLPFKEALLHARSVELKSQKEWQDR